MSSQSSSEQSDEYPLEKSLGYTVRNTFGKVQDARLSQEFNEEYKELEKGSQEYDENFRNRRVADDELNVRRKESFKSSNKLQSLAGRRRVRTQALRRDKLNNQSLRSHLHHSKMSHD